MKRRETYTPSELYSAAARFTDEGWSVDEVVEAYMEMHPSAGEAAVRLEVQDLEQGEDGVRHRSISFERFCASLRAEYGADADVSNEVLREQWIKPGGPGRIRRMFASEPG